jgi:hypothetical protein
MISFIPFHHCCFPRETGIAPGVRRTVILRPVTLLHPVRGHEPYSAFLISPELLLGSFRQIPSMVVISGSRQ